MKGIALELNAEFTPDSGAARHSVVLRIHTPCCEDDTWVVTAEVIGFDEPYSQRVYGTDWAQAIELAAKVLPTMLDLRIDQAGGGVIEPMFFPRDSQSVDYSTLPSSVVAALSGNDPTTA